MGHARWYIPIQRSTQMSIWKELSPEIRAFLCPKHLELQPFTFISSQLQGKIMRESWSLTICTFWFYFSTERESGATGTLLKANPSKQLARHSWVCTSSSPQPSSIPFSNPWASALHPPPFFVSFFLPLSLTSSHKYICRCGFGEVCQWLLSMNEFSILWSVIG